MGIKVERNSNGFHLSQELYTRKILSTFNFLNAHPKATPIAPGQDVNDNSELNTAFPFRKAIGSLLYLSRGTRPDISFTVSVLSTYLDRPTNVHVAMVKHLLRYLAGTIQKELVIDCSINCNINAYVDSDWAGDRRDRKSTSGTYISCGKSPIAWCSKQQACVATSTTEAEYVALALCMQQVKWIKQLFIELNFTKFRTTIFEDNKGCIDIANGSGATKRSKHIDIKCHFIQDELAKGIAKLMAIETTNQIADILTKGLPKVKHDFLVKQILQ